MTNETSYTKHSFSDIPATGKLPYRLTNDYLFRAVFQAYPKALEGLCRSLLHLSPEDIISIKLQNPIELGKRIESKEFILDLALSINHSLFMNLEMQVSNKGYWSERSLSYACRSFDNLNHGDNYSLVLPVIHIGFLDFTLFPEQPEFFSTYKLSNVKNQQIFSDKLCISVVDLTQIELATEEDKKYGIDLWARILKATTWEEINMLAQNNEYLQETACAVCELTEEEQIRQQCQAREDYEYWERIANNMHQAELDKRDQTIQKQDKALQQKDITIQQKNVTIQQKEAELAAAYAKIAELEAARK